MMNDGMFVVGFDPLELLNSDTKIKPDLLVKFKGHSKVVKAHKVFLSAASKVLKKQYFGSLSAHARAPGDFSGYEEVVLEEHFSPEAYMMFVRYIYGDKETIEDCSDYENIFELMEMSKLYEMERLGDFVEERVGEMNVSMEDLLETLKTKENYEHLDGFKNICEEIEKKIVAAFSAYPTKERNKFYRKHREDSPELVQSLMDIMSKAKKEGPEAEPELSVVNVNKFFKFYQQYKGNPDTIKVLDEIMKDFILDDKPAVEDADGLKDLLDDLHKNATTRVTRCRRIVKDIVGEPSECGKECDYSFHVRCTECFTKYGY